MKYRDRHNRKNKETTSDKKSAVRGYFREMGISPLYCSDAVGYIPSFDDLLIGTENEEIKTFVEI